MGYVVKSFKMLIKFAYRPCLVLNKFYAGKQRREIVIFLNFAHTNIFKGSNIRENTLFWCFLRLLCQNYLKIITFFRLFLPINWERTIFWKVYCWFLIVSFLCLIFLWSAFKGVASIRQIGTFFQSDKWKKK